MNKYVNICNIDILQTTLIDLLSDFKKGLLVTPNVDHIVKLQKNREFYEAYKDADYIICDSKIIKLCSFFLSQSISEVIPGSSFFSAYCDFHRNNTNVRIFLLGAADGVAKKAMININKKIGREIIVGAHSPSFDFENNIYECLDIIDLINKTDANVLVVGVGAPKQELWIHKYKYRFTNIDAFMALGATIDFEAGNVKRAPVWLQKLAMEWLYRLLKEPSRLWRRYILEDFVFFKYIYKQKVGTYKNPFSD